MIEVNERALILGNARDIQMAKVPCLSLGWVGATITNNIEGRSQGKTRILLFRSY